MIARLWWKEARQAWPVWAFLAATGLGLQAFVGWYWGADAGPGGYVDIALVFTMIYLFLIAAAVFAGERENGTLGMLDVFPIGRPTVWTAKATFALATTAAMGLLLWFGARVFGVDASEWARRGGVGAVWSLNGLGWGLLWSSILGNALFAAMLAMASLCLCLLALVDLNVGARTFQSAPTLILLAGAAAAASAWIFRKTGPPRPAQRTRPRPRPLATAEATPMSTEAVVQPARPPRVWATTATRLAWQSLREVRANAGMLLALVLIPWLLWFSNVSQYELNPIVILCVLATAIVTGVAAFQGDNRGKTHRFLLQHGARPGLVWGVKLLIWGAVAMTIWWLGSYPFWRTGNVEDLRQVAFYATAALLIGFAASALCGMIFRRAIMAAAISVVACLAIFIPIAALFGSRLLEPRHLPFVTAGVLLVGWAWSGDWLFDRPGLGRWARLGLYLGGVTVVLVSSYFGGRVWGVVELPAGEAVTLFHPARLAGAVSEEANAAPLYREAWRVVERSPLPGESKGLKPLPANEARSLALGDWDAGDPRLGDWLATVEPGLQILREASQKQACRFVDPERATLYGDWGEPPFLPLLTPLIVSARVRSAKGDLDGAWAEIETLLRIARQISHNTLTWADSVIEPAGLGLAMRWAADPRQSRDSLARGLRAYRALPEPAGKADRVRLSAQIFRNTLKLPKDELLDGMFSRWATNRKKIASTQQLMYDLQTTPWEITRARRVIDLLAADRIQEISNRPYELVSFRSWSPLIALSWGEADGVRRFISHEELARLASTTPLVDESSYQRDLSWWDRQETARRALNVIFLLRIWQAGHDGSLPDSLHLISEPAIPGQDADVLLSTPPGLDLYKHGSPFGYLVSEGQSLPPLGWFDPTTVITAVDPKFTPTEGCRLLYSVGPDGEDNRARTSLDYNGRGDIIFPLKDGVKPPADEPR